MIQNLCFNNIFRRIIGMLIITSMLGLSGCVNKREVDKLGLLGAIGVDVIEEDKYLLTLEVNKPKRLAGGSNEQKEPIVLFQTEGTSFFDAIRNATNKFDRKLFLAPSRVIVISEATARKGIADILDFWWRDHESRASDYLVIAKGCNSSDIFGITSGISEVPSVYLADLIKANSASSKSIAKVIYQFINEYYAEGLQPTLGVMEAVKKPKSTEKQDKEILFEGSAVFREDRLVGFLDEIETRSLNIITGKIKSGIIVSPGTETQASSSLEIIKSKSKTEVTLENNQYLFKVKITIDGMLGEHPEAITLREPAVMKEVEQSFALLVEDEITGTIKRVQKDYGLDIFGFGQAVHRKYPAVWKEIKTDWDKIFSSAGVAVEVKINISRTGLFQYPIKSKLGK